MKRIVTVFLALAMVFALVACGGSSASSTQSSTSAPRCGGHPGGSRCGGHPGGSR